MRGVMGSIVEHRSAQNGADRIAKDLAEFDYASVRRLERTRILVRVGPALGLMGTLIPLAPALAGLAEGDVETLADNLRVAFSVTVAGLLVGAIALRHLAGSRPPLRPGLLRPRVHGGGARARRGPSARRPATSTQARSAGGRANAASPSRSRRPEPRLPLPPSRPGPARPRRPPAPSRARAATGSASRTGATRAASAAADARREHLARDRQSTRARMHEDRGGDPLDGLVNLFDLGIVLAGRLPPRRALVGRPRGGLHRPGGARAGAVRGARHRRRGRGRQRGAARARASASSARARRSAPSTSSTTAAR